MQISKSLTSLNSNSRSAFLVSDIIEIAQTYGDQIFHDFWVLTDDSDDNWRGILEVRILLFNVGSTGDYRLYITHIVVVVPTRLTEWRPACRAYLLYVST